MNAIPAPVHRLVGQLRKLIANGTPAPWQSSRHAIGCFTIHETEAEARARPHFSPGLGHTYGYEGRDPQANCDLLVSAVNALPAMLNVIELADAAMCLRNNGDPHRQIGRIFDQLTHALSLLPNAQDHRADAAKEPK